MPHSLYLGSGIVQARLREFDVKAGNISAATPSSSSSSSSKAPYQPSLSAIHACMSYSITELTLSLVIFALFVNSAILIVAGASLSGTAATDADLFGIHDLLSASIAPAAGTIFALALLLSGVSAGIVCTIAGQMVSEGALNWSLVPWLRRLITRSVSIVPSIIIAGAVGAEGLSKALNGTQVALSVILPFVSAPLIYFTCRHKYMTVYAPADLDGGALPEDDEEEEEDERLEGVRSASTAGRSSGSGSVGGEAVMRRGRAVRMANGWVTTVFAVLIWGVIAIMNVALLVLVGLGKS